MTKIEWTDETWNPVTGCTKVSQGCKHCYAERLAPKVFAGQRVHIGELDERRREFTDIRKHPGRLDAPLRWKKPRRVFVNSMSDLFHEDVPFEFIDKVMSVMQRADVHTFQILTKRPARMLEYFTLSRKDWLPLPNVWLGVSVEDQATADERIPLLLQTPAAIRFLSCEPLLGPVDIAPYIAPCDGVLYCQKCGFRTNRWAFEPCPNDGEQLGPDVRINWVIAGGESGPHARPSHPDWFRQLRDQCAAAAVPFFFKQWGQFIPHACAPFDHQGAHTSFTLGKKATKVNGELYWSVGKKAAGRTLDGRLHDEYPA